MKKILLLLILSLFSFFAFAQEWKNLDTITDFDRYEWNLKYKLKKDSNIYTTNKEILRTVEKEKSLIFDCIVFPIYKDSNLSQKRYKDYLFLDEKNIEYYSINDVYVEKSDLLPEEIIYTPGSFGFVPIFYNEVIQSDNPRKKIEEVIPFFQGLYGIKEYGESEYWWQEERFLNAFEVRFSNVIFSIDFYTGGSNEFLITNITKKGNKYILTMYPPKGFDNYYENNSGFQNFPSSENNEIITLILEINPSTLKLYNQNNEFICELMKVSNEWLLDFPNLLKNEVRTENLQPVDLSKNIFNIKEQKKSINNNYLTFFIAGICVIVVILILILLLKKKK